MNKIEKALKKLKGPERVLAEKTIEKILAADLRGLDVKRLRGLQNAFRVRVGNWRIIFLQENSKIILIDFSRRSEKTYKNI